MNYNVFNRNALDSRPVPNGTAVQVVGVHQVTPEGVTVTLFDGEVDRQSKCINPIYNYVPRILNERPQPPTGE